MIRTGWFTKHDGTPVRQSGRLALFVAILTLAIALAINILLFPNHNLAAFYAVPILVASWKGTARVVGGVTVLALFADCFSLYIADIAPMLWPTSLGVLIVIGYLSFRMSIQSLRIRKLHAEAMRHADQAKLASSRLARLQMVTTRLAEARTVEEVADIAISQGVAALGASRGVLALLSDDRATLSVSGSIGYSDEELKHWQSISLDGSIILADSVLRGIPVWIESPAELRVRFPSIVAYRCSPPGEAWCALPLRDNNQPIGIIGLSFSEPRSLTADEKVFALTFAGHCTAAFSRARLLAAEQQARTAAQIALDHRSEFLTVLGHELRTPLTSLRGYAQLVLSRIDESGNVDPQFVRRAFTIVDRQSAKLTRLVNQFIDGAGLKTGRFLLQPSRVDVAALTTSAVKAAQAVSTRHAIRLTAPESLFADIDALRIGQVIDNLLENAVKYNPDGGTVDVRLASVDSQSFEIRVRDYGSGVPFEQRKQLFEPFHRAHAADHRSGLGLGLFVGRQIVEAHGGKLFTEFPEEGGTQFVVVLPMIPPARNPDDEHW